LGAVGAATMDDLAPARGEAAVETGDEVAAGASPSPSDASARGGTE
jgi:hypothetical protein